MTLENPLGNGVVPKKVSAPERRLGRPARRDFASRPSADPLHWWRTRLADDFDDLDLRIIVLILNRYALVRHDLASLSGSPSEIAGLIARRPSAASERDLLMTCLLRNALTGAMEARQLLIQTLRRDGHPALATSWRLVRQSLAKLVLRRKQRAARRPIPRRRRAKPGGERRD